MPKKVTDIKHMQLKNEDLHFSLEYFSSKDIMRQTFKGLWRQSYSVSWPLWLRLGNVTWDLAVKFEMLTWNISLKFVPKLNSTRKLLKLFLTIFLQICSLLTGNFHACRDKGLPGVKGLWQNLPLEWIGGFFRDPKLFLMSWRFIFTKSVTN